MFHYNVYKLISYFTLLTHVVCGNLTRHKLVNNFKEVNLKQLFLTIVLYICRQKWVTFQEQRKATTFEQPLLQSPLFNNFDK